MPSSRGSSSPRDMKHQQKNQINKPTLLQVGKGAGAQVGVEDWDFHWVTGTAQHDQWLTLSPISY